MITTLPHRPLLPAACAYAAVACAFLAATATVTAEPEISWATLSHGRAPNLSPHTWNYLSYRIRNPDPEPVRVRLSLRGEFYYSAVFEKEHVLAPDSYVTGREPVTAAKDTVYQLSLRTENAVTAREEILTYAGNLANEALMVRRVYFINDDPDSPAPDAFAERKPTPFPVKTAYSSAAASPHHWLGFGDVCAVIIGRPDFDAMTALQFRAISEYVHRGGTLIFISPAGTLAAADTPLRALLPVTPLRLRRVSELPALDEWCAQLPAQGSAGTAADESPRLFLAEGLPFLASVPAGDGVTTLTHNEFPLCRWRRCGLGAVGFVAVNPCADAMRQNGVPGVVWAHLQAWTRTPFLLSRPGSSTRLRRLLALLTGYRIPGAAAIVCLLATYAVLLLTVLAGGVLMKKYTAAWTGAVVLALAFTGGTVAVALQRAPDMPKRTATAVDVQAALGEYSGGHAGLSLFSDSDCRPTLRATHPDSLIRAFRPAAAELRRTVGVAAPLITRKTGGRATLPDFSVRALRPRMFGTVYNALAAPLPALPRVIYGDDPPRLEPWRLPTHVPAENAQAYLVFANGAYPVAVRDEQCIATSAATASDLLRLDSVTTGFQEFLASGALPTPCLVLQHTWPSEAPRVPIDFGDFTLRGRGLTVVPVIEEAGAGPVALPPPLIRVEPAGGFASLLRRRGQWQAIELRGSTQVFPFHVVPPPLCADLRLDEATVELEISNPGNNLTFDAALASPANTAYLTAEPGRLWAGACMPTRRADNTFHFSGPKLAELPTSLNGHLLLLLRGAQMEDLTRADPMLRVRANKFKIVSIRAAVAGTMPAAAGSKRF